MTVTNTGHGRGRPSRVTNLSASGFADRVTDPKAVADLNAVKARRALVGGLAVSARTVPRFTRDLDFAVAVADDDQAEEVVRRLRARDYAPIEVLEQDYVERLSGVRLARRGSDVVNETAAYDSRLQDACSHSFRTSGSAR